MRNFCLFLFFSLVSFFSFSQPFEGEISYMKVTHSDTLFYVYTVKNNNVRIDEFDKYRRALRSYVVNTQEKSLYVINPNKNIYTAIEYTSENNDLAGFEVINTGNYKYINGYKCDQWRVRNIERNTEMSYWIAGDNFKFYSSMSNVAISIDDVFLFFKALPAAKTDGVIPFLVENRTLLRSPKSVLSNVEVKPHKIDPSVFSVSRYQKFENLR